MSQFAAAEPRVVAPSLDAHYQVEQVADADDGILAHRRQQSAGEEYFAGDGLVLGVVYLLDVVLPVLLVEITRRTLAIGGWCRNPTSWVLPQGYGSRSLRRTVRCAGIES